MVEDDIEVGRFVTQILDDLGYDTTLATDAEEVLDRLSFDVVLSDVVVPGMVGIEIARSLRRTLPDIPVVLTSGYSLVLAEEGSND